MPFCLQLFTIMKHILIVDDDHEICQLLHTYLEKNAFRATAVNNGKQMWQVLKQKKVDLMVLDLMLPGEDGLEICRTLRVKEKQLPIIILSAKGDETDRIIGLEMGADDYLPKPFNPRELLVRIKVVLRRTQSLPDVEEADGKRKFRFADWRFDPDARQLHSPQGVIVPLSGGETRLLHVLVSHPQRPLNRDQLLELSQGREAQAFDRSIDVLIGRLRKHLNEDSKHPQMIVTERGVGYRFAAKVEKI